MQPHRRLEGLTILLVEDDAAIRRALRSIVTTTGARVLEAEDYASAVAVAPTRPHIALVDLCLEGDRQGDVVAAALREHGIPSIAISADTDSILGRRLDDPVFAAALSKPLSPSALIEAVCGVLDL